MDSSEQDASQTAKPRPLKKPADTALTQQRLPACKPVLDPYWIVFIFVAVGIILIPIGAVCYAYGSQPVEVARRYDQICFRIDNLTNNAQRKEKIWEAESNGECNVTLEITTNMQPPIYVFYELDGFYQNHRRYVKSRSDAQLAGLSSKPDADCKPQQYLNGNDKQPILPCGLVAWSYFNDTYKVVEPSSFNITTEELAPPAALQLFADKEAVNFNPEGPTRGGATLTTTMKDDHRFVLWMETAAVPRFRKLYGKIMQPVKKGDNLTFSIVNRYNTFDFSGKKTLVVGTTTWLGGKNLFLGLAYLATGATSIVLGLVYLALYLIIGRKIGDTSDINWPVPRNPHH